MELEKGAACKIQTTASKGSLAFFQNVLYKGYTLNLKGNLSSLQPKCLKESETPMLKQNIFELFQSN